ncbi:penicillin-binding protein 2 [Patescibacteria group bacterium]
MQAISQISEIIGKDVGEITKKIEESAPYEVLILENIPHQTLILLEVTIDELPGCRIEENTVRNYLFPKTFSHLLGYTGKINKEELELLEGYSITDYVGKTNIEKSYEEFLRGSPGRIEINKDVFGNILSERKTSDLEPGNSLVLYLDSGLQKKIENELQASIKRVGAKSGAAVAMDPNTGGILAMVSLPNFDSNTFSQGISTEDFEEIIKNPAKPLFNRAILGEYATGSTIKPLIASAALEEQIIDPEKLIFSSGKIEVEHEYDPEIIYTFLDWKPHGWVNMKEAIAVSCNVYFYTVGGGFEDVKGLGVNKIQNYLSLFGWGEKTGIDLPQENVGLLPDPEWKKEMTGENWYVGNTYHLSIGQGYLRATPLQVATAFSAIANKGKLLKPSIVQKIVDSEGNTVQSYDPEVIRENFITQGNLEVVREGMKEAVTYGSSVTLNSLPVQVASKTGTAETGKEDFFHNWVTVFAPYDNPEIVLTIVVENVREAQVAALPIAKQVLQWYFSK